MDDGARNGIGGVYAGPASAEPPLDVQILQTASALERLAVDTYRKILALPAFAQAMPLLKLYAQTTLSQHEQHLKAFQDRTTQLGGKVRITPHPGFERLVAKAMPKIKVAADALSVTSTVEKIVTDTYLVDLTMVEDRKSKELLARVMGVEAQHLAMLRAFRDLISAGLSQLIKVPLSADVTRLPSTFGIAPFPDPLEKTQDDLLAEPQTGAVS